MILPRIFRKSRVEDTISTLYGMIVAQARMPIFYRDFGVADTVNGRFELIVLHLALVLRRLAAEGEQNRASGQALFDRFCRDMDHNLREMGVGDLKVPKEMRKIGEAFYGRAEAYGAALAAGSDKTLALALARNLDGLGAAEGVAALRMTAYIKSCERELATQDAAALVRGDIRLPDPAAQTAVTA